MQKYRGFLRYTVQGLTDEQAALSPAASELCLGGIIRHVAEVESGWTEFVVRGPEALTSSGGEQDVSSGLSRFRTLPTETLSLLLARYDEVAERTDELVATLPSLDEGHLLPEAPWFERSAHWSACRVLLHIIAETAQHTGHADIIRGPLGSADHGLS